MYYYIILYLNAKEREKNNKSTSNLLRYGGFSGERQEAKTKKIPKGYHRMPDGTIMKDSDMKKTKKDKKKKKY